MARKKNSVKIPEQKSLFVKSFAQNILIDYSTAKRILIIIDHNLDRIDEYNERKIPLIPGIEESYLPPKIYLMYASSDKKNDSLFNQIIENCDQIATKTIDDQVAQERQWDKENSFSE